MGNGFMKLDVCIATASGWLHHMARPSFEVTLLANRICFGEP